MGLDQLPPADHLAAMAVPSLDGDEVDPDAPVDLDAVDEADGAGGIAPDEIIGPDAWWTVWRTGFQMPGLFLADLKPLAIQPDEAETARAASDAVHALLTIYAPGVLRPQSEVIGHVMTAAPFLLAKAMIVREVIQTRRIKTPDAARAARAAAAPEPRPADSAPREPEADAPPFVPPVNPWAPDEDQAVA